MRYTQFFPSPRTQPEVTKDKLFIRRCYLGTERLRFSASGASLDRGGKTTHGCQLGTNTNTDTLERVSVH